MKARPALTYAAIFLAALLPRLCFVWLYGADVPPVVWGDDWHYERIARQLLAEHAYTDGWFPPGYPLFLAAIYATGADILAVRLLQACLGAATCVVLYLVGRRVYDERAGLVAALLLAFYPPHIYFAWRLMAETVFVLVVAMAALLALRWLEEQRWRDAGWLGVALGVSSLLKSNLFVWPPLLILWLVATCRGRSRVALLAAAGAPFLLLIGLVPMTNLAAGKGLAAPLPLNAGHTLWWANNPKANGYFVIPDADAEVDAFIRAHGLADPLKGASRAEKDRIYQRLALIWIRDHPVQFLRLAQRKLLNAFSPVPRAAVFESTGSARLVYAVSYGLLLPFAVYGLARSLVRPSAGMRVIHLLLGSYLTMVVLFYGTPRFTLVVMPYLSLFAAFAIREGATWRRVGTQLPSFDRQNRKTTVNWLREAPLGLVRTRRLAPEGRPAPHTATQSPSDGYPD